MGLAAAKNKRKLGNDPNNTKWSRNTETFGQKILRAQGWQPGQYLGAKDAPHAEWHTEANSSHIRVVLKDDTMGLGAKRNNGDECIGLDAFQSILGRLNGKSEEALATEQKAREDIKLNLYVERKLGAIRFVSGGWLVGDQVKEALEGSAKLPSDSPKELPEERKQAEPVEEKSKKRKADQSADGDEEKVRKKEKKSKKRKADGEAEAEVDSESSKGKKEKSKKRRQESAGNSDSSTSSNSEKEAKEGETGTEPPAIPVDLDSFGAEARETKKEKKEKKDKKEKKEKKKEKKDKKEKEEKKKEKGSEDFEEEKSGSKSSEKKRTKGTDGPADSSISTPSGSGTSTPVPTGSSRYLARSRFIAQKRMALTDSAALNQIFMIKS
ncbi:hypothetical protein VTK26DRAFT_4620 [Humicola hyalothermophila]